MIKLFRRFQNRNRFATYFDEYKQEIHETNLSVLRFTLIFIGFIFVLFYLVIPLLINEIKPSKEYVWMLPLLLVFGVLSMFIPKNSFFYGIGRTVCFVFYFSLMLVILRIDVYSSPSTGAMYFPVVLVVLPVVFIFQFRSYLFMTILLEAIYLLSSYRFKLYGIFLSDTARTLVGSFFAILVAWIMLRIRTEEGKTKTTLKRLSSMDYLTGIMNKSSCEREITAYLKNRPKEAISALFIIDLDNFKKVNDSLGHLAGDALLAGVGNVLIHSFRTTDIVGRIGGDEFMILLRNIKDIRLIEKKSQSILDQMSRILIADGSTMSCSIGVAIVGNEKVDFEKLYQMADDALYEAKNFGKKRFVIYHSQEKAKVEKRNILLIVDDSEIDRAALSTTFEDDYVIMEAKDGNEALGLLSRYHEKIAIVLLDVMMPKLDGYEVLRVMKSRMNLEKIPVIAISADKGNEEQTLFLGADDMIVKPIDPVITRLRVKRALTDRRG